MLFDKVFIVINYNTLIKRGTETWKNSMFCKLKKKSIIKFFKKNMLILLQKYKNYSVVYQFFLNYIINCICWLSATCINPFLTIMFQGPCHCREWGIIHCRINGVKQPILIHLRQQDIGRIIATIFMEICVKIIIVLKFWTYVILFSFFKILTFLLLLFLCEFLLHISHLKIQWKYKFKWKYKSLYEKWTFDIMIEKSNFQKVNATTKILRFQS